MNRLRITIGYICALLAGVSRPRYRGQLLALATLLRQAPKWFAQGGLPVLTAHLDLHAGAMDTHAGSLENALEWAEALAALTPASPFRVCLRRASLRYVVMRAYGESVALVIGVRKGSGNLGLDGHAWVERQGLPFRESATLLASMTEMYRHPAGQVG